MPVLHDVSFEVPAGRRWHWSARPDPASPRSPPWPRGWWTPAPGAVEVDGVDMRQLSAAPLTRTVALVPQVPFIFDDTRAGQRRARPARPWTGRRCAPRCALAQAESFVEQSRRPGSTRRSASEEPRCRAGSASGSPWPGRWPARPRLLVLDDATSAVDPRVEAEILRGLRERGAAASALIVAYRRATIALADEVVYLERGRVVARGPTSSCWQRCLATRSWSPPTSGPAGGGRGGR